MGEEPGVQRDREFGGVCGWGLKEEVVGSAGVYARGVCTLNWLAVSHSLSTR